jgi:hypothetical protein
MKFHVALKPVHYRLSLLVVLLVAGSVYFFTGGFRFEGEEDEEEEKEESLQAFDLWSNMRTYPFPELKAENFTQAFEQGRHMSLEAQASKLGLNAPTTAPWTELGPWNFSGRILSLAIHPSNANIMFAGSASGGLWKTTTGGTNPAGTKSWAYVPTGFPVLGVSSIAINPTTPNTMFIGTGEVYNSAAAATGVIGAGHIRTFRGSYGIGILKSVDGGTTWTQSLAFTKSAVKGVMDLVINPTNTNIIYAATTDGVYRTIDNGSTWTLVHNVTMAMSLAFKPGDPTVLYVGSGNFSSSGAGIYRCTNATAATPSFTKLTTGLPTPISGKIQLAVTPNNVNVIYASIGNDPAFASDPNGLYKSTDGGNTWTGMQTGANTIIGQQGWYGHSVAVSNANANLVLWGELNTFRSTNGGSTKTQTGTWSLWNVNNTTISTTQEGTSNGYVHADVHRIVCSSADATGNTFFVLTDGGVFKTTNGGTSFITLNGGLNTSQIYSNISVATSNPNFMLCGLQDNEAMIYEGNPGCRRVGSLGDGFHTAIKPNGTTCFVESYYFNRRRSTNLTPSFGGTTGAVAEVACFNVPFVYSQTAASTTMFGGTIYFKKSTDDGVTWNNLNGGAAIAGPQNPMIHMAAPNDNTVYFSSAPSTSPALRSKLWKTTNGGTSFSEITGTLPDRYYSHVAVDPTNANRMVVTLSGFGSSHVFMSTNGGTSWCDIGAGLPDVPTNTVIFDPTDVATIYIGNDIGVYYAHGVPTGAVGASYTLSWISYNEGFSDAIMVSDMAVTSTLKLRLGSYGRGLWERDLAPAATLPARVVTFSGTRLTKVNRLNWTSSVEVNVDKFVVEYSTDGSLFSDVGSVKAVGNSNTSNGYQFDHASGIPGTCYYRLRIVDLDGHTEFSQVVKIAANNAISEFSVYPNPTSGRVIIHLSGAGTGGVQCRIIDNGGRTVFTRKLTLNGSAQDLPVDLSPWPSGVYHVVLDGNGIHWTAKVLKQ